VVIPMSLGGFLSLYFACMVVLTIVMIRACKRYQRQGQLGKAWAMTALAFALVVAHWTWPFLLAGVE
jgi:hypothetical protein